MVNRSDSASARGDRDGLPWTSDLRPPVSELRHPQTKDGRDGGAGKEPKKKENKGGVGGSEEVFWKRLGVLSGLPDPAAEPYHRVHL